MTRIACIICIAGCFLSGSLSAQGHPCKESGPEWISLGVTDTPATVQTVSWRSDKGSTEGAAQITVASPSPNLELHSRNVRAVSTLHNDYGSEKVYHRVHFSDLKPDTQYLYRVGNDDCWSEWFQFKTAKSSAEPFSFLYFGDVQYNIVSLFSRVIRQAMMQAPESSLMMFTGDLVTNATEAEFDEFFQAGGWMLASRVVAPIPDGHEYPKDENGSRQSLATFWNHTFAYPDNVPAEISQLGSYYFDYQNTRFIMFNNYDLVIRKDPDVYNRWLESVLQNNPQKWTVVAHHHPVYPISAHRNKSGFYDRVKPLYDRYDVDLVLTGHDHGYSRGGIDLKDQKKKKIVGPVYVVSVAGPGMYALAFRDWYDRAASNTQMFQHVVMCDDELTFKTYTATGELYDKFVIEKKNGVKKFIDQAPDIVEYTDMPPGREKSFTPDQLEEIEANRIRHLKRKK